MTKRKTLLFCIFCFSIFSYSIVAQDLHYTNYDYSPLYLNPAETGGFYGSVRVSASLRDQYDAFIQNGYNSKMVQLDMPLEVAFGKQSWTGYGMSLYTDQAGDLGLSNSGVLASFSYHLALDKKYQHVVAIGMQVGVVQWKVNDPERARFGDGFLSGNSIDLILLDQFSANYTDYNFGISYKNRINKKTRFELGSAMYHAFKPNIRFSNGKQNNDIYRRINIYGKLPMLVSPAMIVEPRLYMSFMSKSKNVMAQTMVKYNFQDKIKLQAGLGYRLGDAAQFMFGVDYKGWDVGISYDATVSSARRFNNSRGAFEIGLRKIFFIPKEPKLKNEMICPRA